MLELVRQMYGSVMDICRIVPMLMVNERPCFLPWRIPASLNSVCKCHIQNDLMFGNWLRQKKSRGLRQQPFSEVNLFESGMIHLCLKPSPYWLV